MGRLQKLSTSTGHPSHLLPWKSYWLLDKKLKKRTHPVILCVPFLICTDYYIFLADFHFGLVAPLPVCEHAAYDDLKRREWLLRTLNEDNGELNIESMLLVEKGLRELVSLKVCMENINFSNSIRSYRTLLIAVILFNKM